MSEKTVSTVPAPVYTLGSSPAERERLGRQADDLLPHALALVNRVGLQPGASALDLGCGPAGALELLSQRVGPTGRVVGVDVHPAHAALARKMVVERGLDNVEVIEGDARGTGLPPAAFDVVHARLLLVNIPDPEAVIAEMERLVKPGGWVILDEADGGAHICFPPLAAWDRITEIFQDGFRADGADLMIGRKLTKLLLDAGLTDVGTDGRADVYPASHPRRTIVADLVQSMRDKLVQRGIASFAELERIDGEVRHHLADPATVTMSCLYFLAWGRKPVGKEQS
jgi:SAM-dependent methyltransferase